MAAMVRKVFLTVFALSLPYLTVGTIALYSREVEQYCGKTIDVQNIPSGAFRLQTRTSNSVAKTTCDITIKAPFDSRLVFVSESVSFGFSGFCFDRYFEIFDGSSSSGTSASGKVCGYGPITSFTTGRYAFLKITNKMKYDSFKLIITSYKTGYCPLTDFKCSNGRCIDSSLSCNFNDNCGDNSNNLHCYGTSYGDPYWWIWMILGILGFIILVSIIVAIACCTCCKRGRDGTVVRAPPTAYNAGAHTVTITQNNPWYGPPGQQTPGLVQPPAYTVATGPAAYPAPGFPPQQTTIPASGTQDQTQQPGAFGLASSPPAYTAEKGPGA